MASAATPVLTGVSASPTFFYLGGSGITGSTTLKYTLSATATVSVVVRNTAGTTVRTLQASTAKMAGSYTRTWNGRADDGASLPDGSYSLVVTASTAAGTEQSTQTVQLHAPLLTGVSASPTSLYAGGGSTTLSYTLSATATASVVMRNTAGTTVRTLQASAAKVAGSYVLAWDGTGDGGASLPAGSYSLVVTARTAAGSQQGTQTVQVVAPVLTGVSLAPTAIYAGSGSTTLIYTLTGPATASVWVRDASGNTVRTLQVVVLPAGSYALTWDGTGDGGASLPAGSYSLVVSTTTAAGTELSVKTVELMTSALTGVSASPTSFYGGAGASGSTTLSYTLTAPATVAVSVRDALGTTVRTMQVATAQAAGSYALSWDGTGDGGGASLPAGSYSLVVGANTAAGTEQSVKTVQYTPTPVASEASLALNAAGGYVLHTVIENWNETLNGQTVANYYYDGNAQPWEYAATGSVSVTLYVGADPLDPEDTTSGGRVTSTSNATGVADLAFPSSLAWYDANGSPFPLFYSLKLTSAGSSRWYPANGRYSLRAPAEADGHVQFAFMSDIQTLIDGEPTPNVAPSGATQPYTAIPRLSRSLGWSAVLSGLLEESGTRVVLCGGDATQKGGDSVAPDDSGTQLRTLFDNEQSYGPSDEWSLSRLAGQVPVALTPGNHDDIGTSPDAPTSWSRWVYSPTQLPYYSFDQGDVHFVVLDTYTTSNPGFIGFQSPTLSGTRSVTVSGVTTTYKNTAQAKWLIGAIDTDKPWTVVVTHYPLLDALAGQPYSETNQTGSLTTSNKGYYGERNRLIAFFAAHGVDLVLQGHIHNFRHHAEKVRSSDGGVSSAMTFVTDGLAGVAPAPKSSGSAPFIDWVDLDSDGVPDANEPVATAANSPYWDVGAFGMQNSPAAASGYTGTPDMLHAIGEYNNGLTFSYSMFQTGSDAQGAPTLTMTVKFVSWNSTTHAWNPWTVYESAQIPQVDDGMVSLRLGAN